ncbi:ABC transporter substrate-binding protein [bacterium]|nr:ABC transporter substrate-binding protein [bacterium]
MKKRVPGGVIFFLGSLLALATLPQESMADSIGFASWGGAFQAAQNKVIVQPWSKKTGHEVKNFSYNGELAKIKAMVLSKNYEWDVIDLEAGSAHVLCEEGMLERIPESFWEGVGGKALFLESAVHECSVGAVVWSTIFAYDSRRVAPEEAPKSWKEFWDVKKFPGARSLRNSPRGNLEFALLADGVDRNDIYPLLRTKAGIERAFRKLDEIKPHIKKWWSAGAEPPQLLADGEVRYSSAFNGRISEANKNQGQQFVIEWNGQHVTLDHYAIARGNPKKKRALELIAYSLSASSQREFVQEIPFAPVRKGVLETLPKSIQNQVPTADVHGYPDLAIQADEQFWMVYQEELTERFESWKLRSTAH